MSVLQSNSGTNANVTNPPSAAWGSTLTVGSVIVVTTFDDSGGTGQVTSLSGGGVTTWTRRVNITNISVWSGVVTSAVTTAVTFGFSVVAATRLVWLMQERNDIDATTPFDRVSTVATGTSTTATSSTSGTPANTNSTVIGHVTMAASATASLGSGYADLTQAGAATLSARFAAMESKGITSATAQTASFGLSASVAWSALCSIWKAAATGTNYTSSPADPVGITDDVTLLQTNVEAPSDPVGITDTITLLQTNVEAPSDPIGITDSMTAVITLTANPSDPIGITDSLTLLQTNVEAPVDPIGITDAVTLLQTNVETPSDPIGITDSMTAIRGLFGAKTDPIGITDAMSAIITDPFAGQWNYIYLPWGIEQFTITDLTPGVPYDIQIRAMDASGNASPWSAIENEVGALDTVAPSTPAAPTVVSSAIALQISSTLGKASGGTYNLEQDLALLEVHASSSAGFTPTTATKLGTMAADAGILLAAVPAIATFKTDATVAQFVRIIAIDKTGNRSAASATATATPGLIDSAHISDLTASKITAGTIGANVIVGARLATALSGARVELNTSGLQAFNSGGTQTVDISASTGSATITGIMQTGLSGTRIIMDPAAGAPVIRWYPTSGTNYAFINALDFSTNVAIGVNSAQYGTAPNQYQHRLYLNSTGAQLQTYEPVTQDRRGGLIQTDTGGIYGNYDYEGVFGGLFQIAETFARVFMTDPTGATVIGGYEVNDNAELFLRGVFANGFTSNTTQAVYVLEGFVASTFSAASYLYGNTMAGTMCPVYSLFEGSAFFSHKVAARSATGFTISWNSTASGKNVMVWAFRIA